MNRIIVAFLIFLVALTSYVLPLNDRPFFTRGEAREAIVVEEMIHRNDFVLPLRDKEGIYAVATKPPMFHWLGAISSLIAGQMSEASIRFPSAFAAATVLLAMFLFLTNYGSFSAGLLTTMILAGTFEWNRSAGQARVDMVFTMGIAFAMIALYNLIDKWESEKRVNWTLLLAVSLSCGVAALAKGPLGLFLPWTVAIAYVLLRGKSGFVQNLKEIPIVHGVVSIAISAFLVGVWYVAGYQRGGMDFLHVHLLNENLGRFVTVKDFDAGHEKPFFYSLIYLCVSFFPASLLLPLATMRFWRARHELLKEENKLTLFHLIWFSTLFILVTVSTAKRDVYLLPAFPALAYLLCVALTGLCPGKGLDRKTTAVLQVGTAFLASTLSIVALFLATVIFSTPVRERMMRYVDADARTNVSAALGDFSNTMPMLLILLISIALVVWSYWRMREGLVVHCVIQLGIGTILLSGAINSYILPVVALSSSPDLFMALVQTKLPPNTKLLQYKHSFFPAMYYSNSYVSSVSSVAEHPELHDIYLLVRKDDLPEVVATPGEEQILLESSNNSANGDNKLVLVRIHRDTDATKIKL